MKKILGSLLLLALSLCADNTYEWKVELSKKELYRHESATLNMECRFTKEGKNNDAEFVPPANIPFDFMLLSESRRMEEGRKIITFRYQIFAKEAGEFILELQPTMLFMSQSAVDNIIIGRDNVNELEAEEEIAAIDPIKISVKETLSALTGSMRLETRQDIRKASAYEPVHLEILIEGEGNLHALQPIRFEIEGVEVFSDEPQTRLTLGETGYSGSWVQRFAFVGKEDFTIPSVNLAYFDLASQEEKSLVSAPFSIEIDAEGIKKDTLIDTVDLPSEKIDFDLYAEYLYYLLTFIAGFGAAKLLKLPQIKVKKQKGEKIKAARSAKELLDVLIVCEKNLFSAEIDALEEAVYKGSTLKLAEIKKTALSRL